MACPRLSRKVNLRSAAAKPLQRRCGLAARPQIAFRPGLNGLQLPVNRPLTRPDPGCKQVPGSTLFDPR